MDLHQLHVEIPVEAVDHVDVQIGELVKELFHIGLLILVDQRHGGLLKAHEGDQPLKVAGVDGGLDELVGVQVVPVGLPEALPVPAVQVGPLDHVLPLLDGVHEHARLHGAAHELFKFPLAAQNVQTAEAARKGLLLGHHAPGHVVRIKSGPEGEYIRGRRRPLTGLVVQKVQKVFSWGQHDIFSYLCCIRVLPCPASCQMAPLSRSASSSCRVRPSTCP